MHHLRDYTRGFIPSVPTKNPARNREEPPTGLPSARADGNVVREASGPLGAMRGALSTWSFGFRVRGFGALEFGLVNNNPEHALSLTPFTARLRAWALGFRV